MSFAPVFHILYLLKNVHNNFKIGLCGEGGCYKGFPMCQMESLNPMKCFPQMSNPMRFDSK